MTDGDNGNSSNSSDTPEDPLAQKVTGRVEIHLKDGRVLDISGLTIGEVMRRMLAEGVQQKDVASTVHYITGELPQVTCPHCGRTSFNRDDIARGYCRDCGRFHVEPGDDGSD